MKNKNQVVANRHFCYTFTLVVSYILSQHAYRAFLIELKPGGKKKENLHLELYHSEMQSQMVLHNNWRNASVVGIYLGFFFLITKMCQKVPKPN